MSDSSITYTKVPFPSDAKIEDGHEQFVELIRKAQAAALQDGIKANSIIINQNMVRVHSFPFTDFTGGLRITPSMICGMNVYLTKDELPDGYSFAVLESPPNRLAQFESIGMEPDELRKAAELYRRIKEVME